jgi:hypothetical protein
MFSITLPPSLLLILVAAPLHLSSRRVFVGDIEQGSTKERGQAIYLKDNERPLNHRKDMLYLEILLEKCLLFKSVSRMN